MQLLDSDVDTSEWVKNKKKFWAADPVHLTPDGYAELVKVLIVVNMATKLEVSSIVVEEDKGAEVAAETEAGRISNSSVSLVM
jgi:hypothetical protein